MAERKPYLLRLPPELMDALHLWARDELRSLNAQIEFVLREAVRKQRTNKEFPRTPNEGPEDQSGGESETEKAG